MAIIRAARGIFSPLGHGAASAVRLQRLPSDQAATCSTMPKISAEVQERRRISRLIVRARVMTAASSLSSRVGLRSTWSGVPTMPMSCSTAAISNCSRCCSSNPNCVAQAEQVSATRIEWLAVAACLHCKAAKRLLAMPSNRLANSSSVGTANNSLGAVRRKPPPRRRPNRFPKGARPTRPSNDRTTPRPPRALRRYRDRARQSEFR